MIPVLPPRGQTPDSHAHHAHTCRPDPISPRALARRRQRAWPRLELRAALAHVERMVPRDAALWAGKAGATRRRLLDAIVGLAQERQSLEVEETYERLGPLVGLASAGTTGLRIRELEHAGWLVRVSTGRKNHEGSVWRVEVPPRLRAPTQSRVSPNRDIKKETSDLRLFGFRAVEESLTPRLAAPMETSQTTPNPKPATKEPPVPVPSAGRPESVPRASRPSKPTPRQGRPRRANLTRSRPTPTTVGCGVGVAPPPQIWPAGEYLPMRAAVESAARGQAAGPRLDGQVKAVTRALLAGGFASADVAGAVGHVGPCSPMRLLAILSGGHVERAPRPEPELAPGPARELLAALVATLPGVDDGWAGPRVRDRELEERDEAERARQLAALVAWDSEGPIGNPRAETPSHPWPDEIAYGSVVP